MYNKELLYLTKDSQYVFDLIKKCGGKFVHRIKNDYEYVIGMTDIARVIIFTQKKQQQQQEHEQEIEYLMSTCPEINVENLTTFAVISFPSKKDYEQFLFNCMQDGLRISEEASNTNGKLSERIESEQQKLIDSIREGNNDILIDEDYIPKILLKRIVIELSELWKI